MIKNLMGDLLIPKERHHKGKAEGLREKKLKSTKA